MTCDFTSFSAVFLEVISGQCEVDNVRLTMKVYANNAYAILKEYPCLAYASHREDNASHREDNASHREDNASHREDNASHREDNASHSEDNASHREDNARSQGRQC